jgi:type VI secretion system secreted protein Hcp
MPIFMKFSDASIKGTETRKPFEDKNFFEIDSFQFGVGRGVSTPAGNAERETTDPSISEIVVTKKFDDASQGLFKASLIGVDGMTAEVHFAKAAAQGDSTLVAYLTYTLSDAIISGYSVSSGGDKPSESISINFAKIEVNFTGAPAGKGKGGSANIQTYDLTTGSLA